jgi:Ca2+-binding EF-hand superfamily protein
VFELCQGLLLLFSGGGSISLDEFFAFFKGMKASPFGRRMFTIFDVDKSGEIDFKEFVMSVALRWIV